MLRQFKQLFTAPDEEIKKARTIDLSLAVCVLLLEVAHADDKVTEAERDHLHETLEERYNLSQQEAEELIDVAEQTRQKSLDLWSFTNRINETQSEADRRQIMEEIWRIIYADGKLDQHEDYLVKKMANLLRLRHKDMIEAKLKVKREMGL